MFVQMWTIFIGLFCCMSACVFVSVIVTLSVFVPVMLN